MFEIWFKLELKLRDAFIFGRLLLISLYFAYEITCFSNGTKFLENLFVAKLLEFELRSMFIVWAIAWFFYDRFTEFWLSRASVKLLSSGLLWSELWSDFLLSWLFRLFCESTLILLSNFDSFMRLPLRLEQLLKAFSAKSISKSASSKLVDFTFAKTSCECSVVCLFNLIPSINLF